MSRATDSADPATLKARGAALFDAGDTAGALACFDGAAEGDPADAETHFRRGLALAAFARLDEAVAAFRRADTLAPERESVLTNLGTMLRRRGDLDAAVAAHERAVRAAPQSPAAHYGLAFTLLTRGDYARGFAEYEWRLALPGWRRPALELPRWHGDTMAGTLLVAGEQGHGDMIQGARYLPWAARHAGRVVVEAHAPLVRLFGLVPGVEVVPFDPDTPPAADACVPFCSLPWTAGTMHDSVPGAPYLAVPADGPALPATSPGCWRVGLVWSGDPDQPANRFRAVPPGALRPLAARADVAAFSLQMGTPGAAARPGGPLADVVADVTPRLGDFADTAAIMAQLDLVVTVDTATAHLAGALGRPVWVLLGYWADWRWGRRGDAGTPWYPSARLFRQPAPGDWGDVGRRLAEALGPADQP